MQMNEKVTIADPGPLGLAGFGITTCILSLINAGVTKPAALGVVLGLALAYGGGAQLLAGMWEFRKGNTFGATAFSSYGAFWIAFYFILHAGAPAAGMGLFLFFFGILTFYLWIASFYLNRAIFWVFLTLTLTFFLLALAAFGVLHSSAFGGWVGLVCGLSALYTSAAGVINNVAGHEVLPVGKPLRSVNVMGTAVSANA
jgi:succinate-acetate transporter protein